MYYVNNRWLGGTLTNFQTVRKSIDRMIELQAMVGDGSIERYTKKERSRLMSEKESLEKNLQGIRNMDKLPAFLFVIDPSQEHIAVHEANKLGIPVVAVVDMNLLSDPIDYVIPGNDDAIRSVNLSCEKMAEACIEGQLARLKPGIFNPPIRFLTPDGICSRKPPPSASESSNRVRTLASRCAWAMSFQLSRRLRNRRTLNRLSPRASRATLTPKSVRSLRKPYKIDDLRTR